MPEKFKGLTDIEARYRQRYLDLMTNNQTKEVFIERARMLNSQIIFADQQKTVGFNSDLKGSYQKKNIQTASIALIELNVNPKIIKSGLMKVISNTGIQGRWQILANNPFPPPSITETRTTAHFIFSPGYWLI